MNASLVVRVITQDRYLILMVFTPTLPHHITPTTGDHQPSMNFAPGIHPLRGYSILLLLVRDRTLFHCLIPSQHTPPTLVEPQWTVQILGRENKLHRLDQSIMNLLQLVDMVPPHVYQVLLGQTPRVHRRRHLPLSDVAMGQMMCGHFHILLHPAMSPLLINGRRLWSRTLQAS